MRAARTVAAALVMVGLCANSAHAADTVNLSLTRTATDIALYVADKRGYFKAEGLDVKFVTASA